MFFLSFKPLFLLPFLSPISAFVSQNAKPFSTNKDITLAFNCDANMVRKNCNVKTDKRKSQLFAMIGFEDQNSMVMAMNSFESLSATNVAFITLMYSSAVYLTVKQNMLRQVQDNPLQQTGLLVQYTTKIK